MSCACGSGLRPRPGKRACVLCTVDDEREALARLVRTMLPAYQRQLPDVPLLVNGGAVLTAAPVPFTTDGKLLQALRGKWVLLQANAAPAVIVAGGGGVIVLGGGEITVAAGGGVGGMIVHSGREPVEWRIPMHGTPTARAVLAADAPTLTLLYQSMDDSVLPEDA